MRRLIGFRQSRVVGLIVALLLTLPVVVASADPPTTATGTYTVTAQTIHSSEPAGGNTIIVQTTTYSIEGDFVGVCVEVVRVVLRSTGEFTLKGQGVFTGTLGEASGTLEPTLVGTGNVETGAFEGHLTFLSGTGGLANLHGQGTFVGTVLTGDYSLRILSAP